MFSKKRGKMKEHTIFALVFLILVVGFVVFGAGGSTGNISLNKYKMVDGDRVYLGESNYEGSAWPGKDDKNNRRSVSTVSVRPNNNNMRTDNNPEGYLRINPSGSDVRKREIYRNMGMDLSLPEGYSFYDLRHCLTRILFSSGTTKSYEDAAEILLINHQTNSCPSPEELDGDGDGFITRGDEDYFRTAHSGSETSATWVEYGKYILCAVGGEGYTLNSKTNEASRKNRYLAMNGGKVECVAFEEGRHNPFGEGMSNGRYVSVTD